MLTLWEVKQNVKIPSEREKVPTAKHLQEKEGVVACMRMSREAEIRVYQCGYAVYRVGKYTTVFPVHLCGDYIYTMCGDIFCIKEDFFDCQEWYIRLVLEGEDRLFHNWEAREQGKTTSYSAFSEEWKIMAVEESMLEQLIRRECVEELLSTLTNRQRTVILCFFVDGKKQRQIAQELGITVSTVSKTLYQAIRKMQKNYQNGAASFRKIEKRK